MIALDWSGRNGSPKANVGKLTPCIHCGRSALLRHPVTLLPCHKVCEQKHLTEQAAAYSADLPSEARRAA